jgi:hypothetical protein
MIIEFEMPDDGEVAEKMSLALGIPADEAWDQLGIEEGFESLARDFIAHGAKVEDTEGISIELDAKKESKVRKLIHRARTGEYGPAVAAYWKIAREAQIEA